MWWGGTNYISMIVGDVPCNGGFAGAGAVVEIRSIFHSRRMCRINSHPRLNGPSHSAIDCHVTRSPYASDRLLYSKQAQIRAVDE